MFPVQLLTHVKSEYMISKDLCNICSRIYDKHMIYLVGVCGTSCVICDKPTITNCFLHISVLMHYCVNNNSCEEETT